MKKRGISPLIATILLIGFTVGLAMLVFTWGGGLFRDITESTETQATDQLVCVNDLSLVLSGCDVEQGGQVSYTIENKKSTEIEGYILRIYNGNDNYVATVTVTKQMLDTDGDGIGIGGFGIVSRADPESPDSSLTSPKRIELLNPQINKDGKTIACPDFTKETTCS